MLIRVNGTLRSGVTAKDKVLYLICELGTAGATGYAVVFAGDAISALSMEGRMTLCNMAIEAGARVGLVAVDDKTIGYLRGRPFAPRAHEWDRAVAYWRSMVSDEGAPFDAVHAFSAGEVRPMVTWGTSPEMVAPIDECVPDPADEPDAVKRASMERALKYITLSPNI